MSDFEDNKKKILDEQEKDFAKDRESSQPLQLTDELKAEGIEMISYSKKYLYIEDCDGHSVHINLFKDSISRTLQYFESLVNGSFNDSLKKSIKLFIAEAWGDIGSKTKSKSNSNSNSKKNKGEEPKEEKPKRTYPVYKYSSGGKIPLHEAIILQGKPCYIYHDINSKSFIPKETVDEETRVLRPPNREEYQYTPYEFKDKEELDEYYQKAASIKSIGELYKICKEFFQKYVDQDKHVIVLLASDAILTHFQDLFSVIHYVEAVGGNDAGKSSVGYTFAYTGYRVIRGVGISGPNYIRVLGSIEQGQCVIIEDEADNISKDPDKITMLKAGYEHDMKSPKTNMNTVNQETSWYYPYGYKMILSESSLSQYKAKGLIDRTFEIKCVPGIVKHYIKDVVTDTINKSPELAELYNQLLDFRKLMICYRLKNYTRPLPDIETNLYNRNMELTKPTLQLFYGTEYFEEINDAMEVFINQRIERKSNSLEASLYRIVETFVDEYINLRPHQHQPITNSISLQYSDIWKHIIDGNILGTFNPNKETEYITASYGTIYRDTLSKMIEDQFGAKLAHNNRGSVLKIDVEKFRRLKAVYSQKGWFKIKVWLKKDGKPKDDPNNNEKEESSSSVICDGSDTSDGILEGSVQNNDNNEMTRDEIIEAIEKAVLESNDSDKYICPVCNEVKLKQHKDVHKMSCND